MYKNSKLLQIHSCKITILVKRIICPMHFQIKRWIHTITNIICKTTISNTTTILWWWTKMYSNINLKPLYLITMSSPNKWLNRMPDYKRKRYSAPIILTLILIRIMVLECLTVNVIPQKSILNGAITLQSINKGNYRWTIFKLIPTKICWMIQIRQISQWAKNLRVRKSLRKLLQPRKSSSFRKPTNLSLRIQEITKGMW
jgi:hypothetical protein